MLKIIELFAGIGAQRQALKKAKIKYEVLTISEIDIWTYSFSCTDASLY